MGELLLCNGPMAAMPFYVETLSLNIYSLEELCYVMERHMFLLDEGFFGSELIFWIERELGETKLAEELRRVQRNEDGIAKIMELIFRETGYFDRETVDIIIGQVKAMQHKSVFERRKMRADRYVENKKYINALLEYRRTLQMEEDCRNHPVVCGTIWHNMGTVFARLFLFDEAKDCFEAAYKHHLNPESIYAAMACCHYMDEPEKIKALADTYGVEEGKVQFLEDMWQEAICCPEVLQGEEEIEEMFGGDHVFLEHNVTLMNFLQEWKEEYQKNCR